MRVASVNNNVLSGCVSALDRREQKHDHRCDFDGLGHPMPKRDAPSDVCQSLLWIFALTDPALIQRCHYFSGQNSVGTNAERSEFSCPFASQSKLSSLGRCVCGGASLTG